MPRRILVPLVILFLAVACSSSSSLPPLPPPVSVPSTTTTTVVDYSKVAIKGVPGRTTTSIAVQPGSAAISGTVVGPGGPVANASVRAERLVGDGVGSIDVVSNPDGTFAFAGVLGGRYRLRAWKQNPDNLALIEPQVFFLEGKESKVVNLSLKQYQGAAVTSDIAPNPPVIEQPANLIVQVVSQLVDENGIVRSTPLPGARLELFGAGDWRIRTANPMTSNDGGNALFVLECRRAGQQPLSVIVGDSSTFPLDVPACTVAVTPDNGSSTTAPPGGGATTSAPPRSTTTAR